MSIPVATTKRWSAEYIAILVLTATLVAVTIVCIICISLSPAHILFGIQDASLVETRRGKQDGISRSLNFTLRANNTSRRMKVHYSALSTEVWFSPTGWVVGEVTMPWEGHLQPAGNVSNIRVSANFGEGHSGAQPPPSPPAAPGVPAPPPATVDAPISWPYCKVTVAAKVTFVYGLVRTRPFDIRVACFPVNFLHGTSTYIACNRTE